MSIIRQEHQWINPIEKGEGEGGGEGRREGGVGRGKKKKGKEKINFNEDKAQISHKQKNMFNFISNQKNDHLNPVEMPFHAPSAGKILLIE